MASLWEQTASIPGHPALEGDLDVEVLVIGGGICGTLCAYELHQAGVDYALVEARTLASGATRGTTAKITAQHGFLYHRLIRRFGKEWARDYLQANLAALDRYKALCRRIDCDFREQDAFVYALKEPQLPQREAMALEALGAPASFTTELPLPFPVAGAVCLPGQAQFHPLKFLAGISEDLRICEHTRVLALEGTTALTDRGRIRARQVIVATHFPFMNKHGAYFIKMYQHRSYVIALENAPSIPGIYVGEDHQGLSFRRHGDLLLLGGGGHRTGKQGGGYQELRDLAKRYFPEATERYAWSAQDCVTLDDMPYIGPYSPGTPGVYVVTGANKWGMTTAMVAAQILSCLVRGKPPAYGGTFSPQRSILRPRLISNAFHSAAGLLSPTVPRCPHLGCALKWDPQEHTWDCPCHGSRFSQTGQILEGPANGDLKKT